MSGDIPMIHGYEEQHEHVPVIHETGDVRQVIERLLAELRGSHLGGVSRERAIEIAEVLTKEG